MDISAILAFASAIFAVTMAFTVAWHERRSIAHWSLAAGMVVLATESLFSGLSADALAPAEAAHWQNWRLLASSFLPGIWLFFSLCYARGNYREFLVRWRLPLISAFLAPVGLALLL